MWAGPRPGWIRLPVALSTAAALAITASPPGMDAAASSARQAAAPAPGVRASGAASSAPALAATAQAYWPSAPAAPAPVAGMDQFVQGTDSSVWLAGWDGVRWTGWSSVGGPFAFGPAVASWGPGRVDLFATGLDGALWHRVFDGAWSYWESLDGGLTAAPAVASRASGRLDIFVRGTDDALWHKVWDNGWSYWESLGGGLTSAPAVASWASGRLDIFVRGTDNALWHKVWDNGWSYWESLGGGLTSQPAVAAWATGHLDIFARGGDNALWHKVWDNGWSYWESLGGVLNTGPGAATWGSGQLDVFAAGTDNAVWHVRRGSGGWGGWNLVGGSIIAAPAPTSWAAVTNTIAGVPYNQQVFELSCEEASLQMVLARQGVNVTQDQILRAVGVDGRSGFFDSSGVLHWGNPNASFVGDPNGSEVMLTGYGTYAPTIARVANGYGVNVIRAGEGVGPADVYQSVLTNHPVVAWVAFDFRYHGPGSMLTWDGQWVQYEGPVEHAVVVIGVNQNSVLINNPWPANGQQWVSKPTFEAAYATYHEMAVVIQ